MFATLGNFADLNSLLKRFAQFTIGATGARSKVVHHAVGLLSPSPLNLQAACARTMAMRLLRLLPLALLTFIGSLSSTLAADGQDPAQLQQSGPPAQAYSVGDAIPISCLNRTIDTGEHVEDEKTGQLQYIPFWTCKETSKPLELYFGVEREVNCTVESLSDELYHLLEFYIHNDAPLTCRIPSRPASTSGDATTQPYTPLTISLTGMLQLSHLHIANAINVILHAAPRSLAPGTVDAATAYSVSPADPGRDALHKVIIGDALPLRLSVRWYPDTRLPPAWQGPSGVGGHLFVSTLAYCFISATLSAVVCVAYFRGVDLPRRLQSYGRDKLGMDWLDRLGRGDRLPTANAPKYNGYGYGVSTGVGNGWNGTGKRD